MGDIGVVFNPVATEPDHLWECDSPTCEESVEWPETSGVPDGWYILSVFHNDVDVTRYYHAYGCMIHDALKAVARSKP